MSVLDFPSEVGYYIRSWGRTMSEAVVYDEYWILTSGLETAFRLVCLGDHSKDLPKFNGMTISQFVHSGEGNVESACSVINCRDEDGFVVVC